MELMTVHFVFVYDQLEFKDFFDHKNRNIYPKSTQVLYIEDKKTFDYYFNEFKKYNLIANNINILNHKIGLAEITENNKKDNIYFRVFKIV